MSVLEWSDTLVLGNERMDATHREFVEHLNALGNVAPENALECLDALIAHTREHFEQENRWMREAELPMLHCHGQEHDGVLMVMDEVRKYLLEGKPQLVEVLARELGPWFQQHAATMDTMLAAYLANPDLAAPVCGGGTEPCGHDAPAACGTGEGQGCAAPGAADGQETVATAG